MSYDPLQSAQTTLKRPRPVLSCLECRRKKLKCDRLLPCQQCVKLGQPSSCKYAPGQEPEVRSDRQILESATKKPRHGSTAASSPPRVEEISDLHDRVRKLEQALRFQQTPDLMQETPSDAFIQAAAPSLIRETSATAELAVLHPVAAAVDEDFSLFEKFEDFGRFIESLKQHLHQPDVQLISLQLYAIQNAVARKELIDSVSVLSNTYLQNLMDHMSRLLPAAHIRSKLIDLYFGHFEHCSRILHKPDFTTLNHKYDSGILDQAQVEYFVPALLGVLSIASNLFIFPECDLPALHGYQDGIGAIQLMSSWYDIAIRRDGVTTPAVQVKVLAMQLQRYRDIKLTELWTSSGQLIRQAITQGLHKEGLPRMSNHEAEIQRCLWLTILEQDLALAISCELPPQCPSYDLRPPANCDDRELSETSSAPPPDHSTDRWTDGLCQHILGTTFNRRLKAYQHTFAPRSSSHYAETLEHARLLDITLRELPALFRFDHLADHAANTPGRLMAQMDLDITLRRSIVAIYAPYARSNSDSDVPQDVRAPWTQSNLVVICFQDLFDPQYPAIDVPRPVGYWDFYYTAYRYDVTQSLEAILLEARCLKREDKLTSGQGPDIRKNRSDGILGKILHWNLRSMLVSIEDTLGPMKRRVGTSNGNLREVVRYGILYDLLRSPSDDQANKNVIEGLQTSLSALQKKLEREGYAVGPNSRHSYGPIKEDWLITFLAEGQ